MKLSLRVLVAALALSAAGGAFAQTATSASTGTDLYFYAYNDATSSSFIIDLGSTLTNFNGSVNTTPIDLATNAAYESFIGNITAADGATNWGVFAAGSNGGTYLDVTSASSSLTGIKGTVLSSTVVNINNLMSGLATVGGAPTGGYTSSGAVAQNAQYSIDGLTTLTGLTATSAIGSTATFLDYNAPGVAGKGAVTPTAFAGTWSFNGTDLAYKTVAAVPEPSSYLMMLGGLLMMGALSVRRRNSK